MASKEAIEKYRTWLSRKGVTGLPDSEIERYIRSTRKQLLFWGIVILAVLVLTAIIVWRDLH